MKKCCPGVPIAFILVFAIMILVYYRYSFSAVSKIDFSLDTFYENNQDKIDLFTPKSKSYNLCFFSSSMENYENFLIKNSNKEKVLAIDFYQMANIDNKQITNIKIGSQLMLKLIFEFDIRKLPQCFIINANKENNMLYERLRDDGFYKLINFRKD